jgi:uncharacterized protein YbjQ (UPF0145 family)
MRNTPETDAQLTTFTSLSKLKKHFVNRTGTVSAEFARGLERERDNLQDQRDFAMGEMARLERERDEAKHTVLRLRKQRAIARNFGDQMERERDEAREAFAVATNQLVQAQEVLREIAAADWKTSGELRGMAKRLLEGEK